MKYLKASQILVQLGLLVCSISDGFIFGQMSGMVDSLLGDDDSIEMTKDDVSLMAALVNLTCIVGFMILGVLTELFGRRRTITFLSIPMAICWIAVYYATTKITLLLTRIIVGISFGGVIVLCYICVGEFTPPMFRSISLTLVVSGGSQIGTTLGHMLSIFLNWRLVALIGLVPTILSCIIPIFWVESPSWLASKGRFDECRQAYRSLHVMSEDKENELENLITLEKLKCSVVREHHTPSALKKIVWASKQLYFWKIILLCVMTTVYRVAAGRILFFTMALTILKDLTGYSNLWIMTLLVDGFSIFGVIMSCLVLKLFKIRTIVFVFGAAGNVVLIILSIVLYCRPDVEGNIGLVKALLLALYLIIINSGPYAAIETLSTEVFPLEAKVFSVFLVGVIASIMQFLAINFAQDMFSTMGYPAVFLMNASIIFIVFGYLWIFLPETKGKTLQEIEMFFKKDSSIVSHDLCNGVTASNRMLG